MNLIYVADSMCSWCYGFGRTLDALLAAPGYARPLQLALVMGGLRPYTKEPLAREKADEIFGHWQHVYDASGQPFAPAPNTALHLPGFVYDTEPAARATVTVRSHWPKHTWLFFRAVQQAFYAEGRDVTRPEVLADIAEARGLPRADFAQAFASPASREATANDFAQAQQWGIRGFPAVIAEHAGELHLVAQGYTGIDDLRARLAALQGGPGPAAANDG